MYIVPVRCARITVCSSPMYQRRGAFANDDDHRHVEKDTFYGSNKKVRVLCALIGICNEYIALLTYVCP